MLGSRLVCCFAALIMQAYGQAPKDASLSLFELVWNRPGLLRADTREALLQRSPLSPEEKRMVSDSAAQVFEMLNVEGEAAKLRRQGDADFTSLERRRSEFLHKLAAILEERLGPDGWKKFNSFLLSLEPKIHVYPSFCDKGSRVYTLGIILQSGNEEAITALAVADTDYHADGTLYAAARLRSPDNRQITAESPAGSLSVHASAAASLAIGLEDGSYQGNFKFGEFCGGEKTPRIYADQPN